MTGEGLGDALDSIEFGEAVGWPPDRGPAMSERSSPDELAKAEQAWRWRAEHPRGINLSTGQKVQLRMLLAEFDRLRLVEQAATTLVEEWEAIRNPADKLVWTIAEQLTERLAAAVHGETR